MTTSIVSTLRMTCNELMKMCVAVYQKSSLIYSYANIWHVNVELLNGLSCKVAGVTICVLKYTSQPSTKSTCQLKVRKSNVIFK